jgi:hypothetical protein
MSLVRSSSSRAKGSSVSAYQVAAGHPLCGAQVLTVGAPLRSGTGFRAGSAANLPRLPRWGRPSRAARHLLSGLKLYSAFLHLMPFVHKVIPAIAAGQMGGSASFLRPRKDNLDPTGELLKHRLPSLSFWRGQHPLPVKQFIIVHPHGHAMPANVA